MIVPYEIGLGYYKIRMFFDIFEKNEIQCDELNHEIFIFSIISNDMDKCLQVIIKNKKIIK